MRVKATSTSAAIAGAWAAFGLIPFEAWSEHYTNSSVLLNNLVFLAAAAVFFFVPAYFFVIGRGNAPFSQAWFTNREERARYGVIVKRMLVWFVSAGIVGAVWSSLFGVIVRRATGA